MKPKTRRSYKVLRGIGVRGVRHEPGEVVDDIPAKVVRAWLAEGVIAEMGD